MKAAIVQGLDQRTSSPTKSLCMSLVSNNFLARCDPRSTSILAICNDVFAINRHLICMTAQRLTPASRIPIGLTSQLFNEATGGTCT
jgi:hypothetical protein